MCNVLYGEYEALTRSVWKAYKEEENFTKKLKYKRFHRRVGGFICDKKLCSSATHQI